MNRIVWILLFTVLIISSFLKGQEIKIDEYTFGSMQARHLGPGIMSGRISALDAVQNDPRVIWVGSASGGIWKSVNGGVSFKAIFDKYNPSIGAITIDQKRPDTVWVGTGETWVRNSVSIGNGIYRTTDGGDNWIKSGLENTERISRILIHPSDPNIVFVAVLGHLWNSNPERGVYKTTDGGKTWEKIFYVNDNTGCSDLAMDYSNPDILYASMWNFRRQPWFFRSGGEGSGVFRSSDGGKTWQRITNGLPADPVGRSSVSVSPVNPAIVFALIEAETSGLYRSDDHGMSWKLVNTSIEMGERPFYFSYIYADPSDTNRVYKPGYGLNVSNNGGLNFRGSSITGGNIHGDMHPVWVSSKDNHLVYLGTDGGLYISHDIGNSWKFVRSLPVSQFYHVAVDNKKPYNVYGGLQDNGSWYGPSQSPGGIDNKDWGFVGYGDGFNVIPDRYDENIIYWQYQGGYLRKKYKATGEVKDIRPFTRDVTDELRFNWNTPLVQSPSSKTIYTGAQYIFKSDDMGDSWTRISPDLTTNDLAKLNQEETGGVTTDNTSAENHCTIYTINESPLDQDIIWAGTDDGNVQLSKDGGKIWENLSANIPGLPLHTWCSYIYPGRFDKAVAYATFDGHRTGDKNVYIYKTNDYGKNWTSLISPVIQGYCHIILEDFKSPGLLFLGTEAGLFISLDDGKNWAPFKGNMPVVPVMDMVLHPREDDLIIATHGRGIMIIGDIDLLRQINTQNIENDFFFFETDPYKIGYMGWELGFSGDDDFVATNPQNALAISYFQKKRHVIGDMQLKIFNEKGEFVCDLPASKNRGINNVYWSMNKKPPRIPKSPQFAGLSGPPFQTGNYIVKVIKDDVTYEHKIKVEYDTSFPYSADDRNFRMDFLMNIFNRIEELAFLDRKITSYISQIKEIKKQPLNKSLGLKLDQLNAELEFMHNEIVATKEGAKIFGEEKLREKLGEIYSSVMSYQGKPTESQINRFDQLQEKISGVQNKFIDINSGEHLKVNSLLLKNNLKVLTEYTREEFDQEK